MQCSLAPAAGRGVATFHDDDGVRVFERKGPPAAIPFFKRAVELDSDFAVAYLYLSFSYGNAGQQSLFEESLKRLCTDYIDIYQIHQLNNEEDLAIYA